MECNVSGVSEINNKSAKEFYTAYQSVNRDSTWAINVSFEQLHLLNKTYQDLGSSAADHSGIRLYYGLNPAAPSGPIRVLAFPLGDQSPTPIADLSIDPVNYIDLSMDIYRQPCPYFCD